MFFDLFSLSSIHYQYLRVLRHLMVLHVALCARIALRFRCALD